MEKNSTPRCQSLGEMFNRKYWLSIALSSGILFFTMLTCCGLITGSRTRASRTDAGKERLAVVMRPDMEHVQGIGTTSRKGKKNLLRPACRKFQFAGLMPGKREAWEIVRE